ncbi:hypothetical protein PIB30_045318 [Stylosanthes scabra]|uniref:Uncharacterized protein n=1 Tax=Stylosanthes scabra TaxID=79078 RepID=A0ABU6WE76_9FABA|nr:hypothetical protein [Stylosanthes scabra]
MRLIAPFSPRPAASPGSSASSGSVGSVHRDRSRSPRTLVPPMAPALVPGPVYPVPCTPMCNARRYQLERDPDEPYVAERVPYGAPEAYYSDVSDGSERESARVGLAPSSHHSSGSASLGYGSASSGSASDGASDDDLVNYYFAGTFPPP